MICTKINSKGLIEESYASNMKTMTKGDLLRHCLRCIGVEEQWLIPTSSSNIFTVEGTSLTVEIRY